MVRPAQSDFLLFRLLQVDTLDVRAPKLSKNQTTEQTESGQTIPLFFSAASSQVNTIMKIEIFDDFFYKDLIRSKHVIAQDIMFMNLIFTRKFSFAP